MNLGQPLLDKEGYARVLGTMREKTLLSEIRESAIAHDLHRLRCMVEFGVFAVQPLLARLSPQVAQNAWADRCEAVLGVMANASATRISPQTEAVVMRTVFDVPGEARQFFSGVCQMISREMEVMGTVPDDGSRTWPVVSQAMGLAAMLDEPEILQRMIDTHPNVAVTPFPDKHMGDDPDKGLFMGMRGEANSTMALTPLFCALSFSSPACVKALMPLSADIPDLCSVSTRHEGTTCYDFEESLTDVRYCGSPEAMVPMMKHLLVKCHIDKESTNPLNPVLDALRDAMEIKDNGLKGFNNHLIPAMIDAGWLDLQPARAYDQAVKNGEVGVIDHFEGAVDWDKFMARAVPGNSASLKALEKGRTAGVFAMIEQATRAGREDAALHQFMKQGLLTNGATKVLLTTPQGVELLPRLLAIGLDPNAPTQDTAKGGLHDVAKSMETSAFVRNPALDILNSFVARTKAHALIDELDEQKAGHALR